MSQSYYKTEVIITEDILHTKEVQYGKSNDEKHQDKLNDFLKKIGKSLFKIDTSTINTESLSTHIIMVTTITYLVSVGDQ